MRIAIVTVYNYDYERICAVTNPNKEEYAAIHGYHFIPLITSLSYQEVFFERYRLFHNLCKCQLDWLFCCDGDFIFTNPTIPIESLIQPTDCVIMAKDAFGLQAGAFLVKNSECGRRFLESIAAGQKAFEKAPGFDQSAIEAYIKQNPNVVRFVPQRQLQSYEYSLYSNLGENYAKAQDADGNDGQWQKGDFGFHCPAVMDQKIQVLTEHLQLVVK